MFLLFLFIAIGSFILLIIGLVKPSKAIFFGTDSLKTRGKVWLIYGLGGLVSFIISIVVANHEYPAPVSFYGTITYEATVEGSNKEGVELFKAGAASKIICKWSKENYLQHEVGGLSEGIILLNYKNHEVFFLDTTAKTAEKARYYCIDSLGEAVKSITPQIYSYKIEKTSETDVICGFKATKYIVKKSGFVKEGAKAMIWVNDSLSLIHARFNFETDWKRIISPLPVSFGYNDGLILKIVVDENNVVVTYNIKNIDYKMPANAEFEIPAGYTIKTKEK